MSGWVGGGGSPGHGGPPAASSRRPDVCQRQMLRKGLGGWRALGAPPEERDGCPGPLSLTGRPFSSICSDGADTSRKTSLFFMGRSIVSFRRRQKRHRGFFFFVWDRREVGPRGHVTGVQGPSDNVHASFSIISRLKTTKSEKLTSKLCFLCSLQRFFF